MKKIIRITLLIVFTGVLFSCSNKKDSTNCCLTEECKKKCIDLECCEEGKTCDITGHKQCKQKCCSLDKKECTIEGEKSCCKTKKSS